MTHRARPYMPAVPLVLILLLVSLTIGVAPTVARDPPLPAAPPSYVQAEPIPGARVSSVTQQGQNVEVVGQIGGATTAVVVAGNYAYVTVGPRLVILDISDTAHPVAVGQSERMPETPQGLALAGNFAYIADGAAGVYVLDVSNPTAPTIVSSIDTPGTAKALAAVGTHLFVADWDKGLRILDISSPTAPIDIGFIDTPGEAQAIVVAGDYAYVADGATGLRVFSIANPSSPTDAGSYDTPGSLYTYGLTIVGDFAYLAAGNGGLRAIDVSDPANPRWAGWYSTGGDTRAVVVAGTYVFVAREYGMSILRIRESIYFTPVASYGVLWTNTPRSFAVEGGYVYLPWNTTGLRIVDVSNPSSPRETGTFYTPAYIYGTLWSPTTTRTWAIAALPSAPFTPVPLYSLLTCRTQRFPWR